MSTLFTQPVDGFRLAYDAVGSGPAILFLHGWPGARSDWDDVVAALPEFQRIAPDLRGFGHSDKHARRPEDDYSADAQVRSLVALLDEREVDRVLIAAYDVGSRVAQTLAKTHPDRVAALVIAPPLPGVGTGVLDPKVNGEYWYQQFHTTELIEELIDGDEPRVRAYLRHFWAAWSAPEFEVSDARISDLVRSYAVPGALVSSIAYYRAGAGTVKTSLQEAGSSVQSIAAPTWALWPGDDRLLLDDWQSTAQPYFDALEFVPVPGSGHFLPVEKPQAFIDTLRKAAASEKGRRP